MFGRSCYRGLLASDVFWVSVVVCRSKSSGNRQLQTHSAMTFESEWNVCGDQVRMWSWRTSRTENKQSGEVASQLANGVGGNATSGCVRAIGPAVGKHGGTRLHAVAQIHFDSGHVAHASVVVGCFSACNAS